MKHTIIALLLAAIGCAGAAAQTPEEFTAQQKLGLAYYIINNFYVEPVSEDSIAQEAIIGMLKTLDPHSAYSTPAETKELTQPLEGKFSGIGVQFNMSTDTVYVVQTTPMGPSEKVGIRPGDRIIQADDSVIAGKKIPNSGILKILRGDKGTTVRLKVKRPGVPELLDFTVVRDDIPIHSVDEAYMAAPGVGYIRLTRFAEESDKEVGDAIEKLKRQGMKKLILDLESNGGGYLGSGVKVASLFLPTGAPVVSTNGRADAAEYEAVRMNTRFDGPLVVLVDQSSASAAEILAGAVQDNDRGTVVGRRTFGKGLVQRPFPMPDGSLIRLTVSKYYTPSGRCIQRPYEKGHGEEYYLDQLSRMDSGELFHRDSIRVDSTQVFYTLKKHRPVFGGGGIIPDEFVPVDTSYYSPYYRDVMSRGIPYSLTLGYVDTHRDELLKAYPNDDAFQTAFQVPQELIDSMVEKAKAEGIEPNEEQMVRSMPLLRAILKGLLARDLYENGSYARAINDFNPTYRRALELLTK